MPQKKHTTSPRTRRFCYLLLPALLLGCSDRGGHHAETPEEGLQEAISHLQAFSFEPAYSKLSSIRPRFKRGSTNWELATYSLALSAWHKTPVSQDALTQASELLNELINENPHSSFSASALLDLGRMNEVSDYGGEATDVALAQNYYQRARESFPKSTTSARATLYLAQSMVQTFDRDEIEAAIELIKSEMAVQPESPWIGTMAQYTAQLYAFYLDDPKASLPFYKLAMERGFPREAEADVSLWQYGLLAQEAGDEIQAAQAFTQLIATNPRSQYGAVARERIVRISENNPTANIRIPDLPKIGIGR